MSSSFGKYIFKTEQTIQLFSELVGTREIKVGKIENALRFGRQYSIEMQPYLNTNLLSPEYKQLIPAHLPEGVIFHLLSGISDVEQ